MLESSLHGSRDPRWQAEPDYSYEVAYLLDEAGVRLTCALQTGNADDFQSVVTHARACDGLRQSRRQAIRAAYLVGRALGETRGHALALEYFDEALEDAARLGDTDAFVELAHCAGAASGQLFQYRSAAEYDQLALEHLALLDIAAGGPRDAVLELQVLTSSMSYAFMLARPHVVMSLVAQARELLALMPDSDRYSVPVDWVEALLHRWRGEPERALPLAERALRTMRETAEPARQVLSLGRLHGVVAEIALDLAGRFPAASSARDRYVRRARHAARASARIAADAGDDEGQVLAALARARLDNAMNRNVDRLDALHLALGRAHDLGDTALGAQALTAIGREFDVLGHDERASIAYRRALAAIEGTDLPALGIFPRRALLERTDHTALR